MTFILMNPVGGKTELTEAEARDVIQNAWCSPTSAFLDGRSVEEVWRGLVDGTHASTAGFGRPGYGGLWNMSSR